mgnify:CR=1 FL=1|jgi:carbon monoxide dehydrogenase subunit G
MKTTIEKTFTVHQPLDKVWSYLSDPAKVIPCVPGAELTEQVGEGDYRGTVSLKVGPISVRYKGEITIDVCDPETHTIRLVGRGLDSHGKGSASMSLWGQARALEDNTTEVINRIEISVAGMLAQFGTRLIEDVSGRLFGQFITCFEALLRGENAAESGQTLQAGTLLKASLKSATDWLLGKKA